MQNKTDKTSSDLVIDSTPLFDLNLDESDIDAFICYSEHEDDSDEIDVDALIYYFEHEDDSVQAPQIIPANNASVFQASRKETHSTPLTLYHKQTSTITRLSKGIEDKKAQKILLEKALASLYPISVTSDDKQITTYYKKLNQLIEQALLSCNSHITKPYNVFSVINAQLFDEIKEYVAILHHSRDILQKTQIKNGFWYKMALADKENALKHTIDIQQELIVSLRKERTLLAHEISRLKTLLKCTIHLDYISLRHAISHQNQLHAYNLRYHDSVLKTIPALKDLLPSQDEDLLSQETENRAQHHPLLIETLPDEKALTKRKAVTLSDNTFSLDEDAPLGKRQALTPISENVGPQQEIAKPFSAFNSVSYFTSTIPRHEAAVPCLESDLPQDLYDTHMLEEDIERWIGVPPF